MSSPPLEIAFPRPTKCARFPGGFILAFAQAAFVSYDGRRIMGEASRKHARDCDGKPCECGVNPPPKLPVWQAFERVRADARKTPQYDKGAWETLQSEILALIYPRQVRSSNTTRR